MNTYHVVAVAGRTKYNLKLEFSLDGSILSEEVYRTEEIKDMPQAMVTGNMLDAWAASDKTLKAAKELFYHSVVVSGKRVFLQPLELTTTNDNLITGGDYTIYNNPGHVIVNYKPGKLEIFGNLTAALDWIINTHYPVQQVKTLNKVISSIGV